MRWLVLALLLISAPASASPQLLLLAAAGGSVAFTINGNSSISSAGTTDTGTESITTGAGSVAVTASCSAAVGNPVELYLIVDGVNTLFSCISGETKTNQTVSYAVTAGSHNIRVVGSTYSAGASTFSASNFRKPKP